jgi:hypothetical protein
MVNAGSFSRDRQDLQPRRGARTWGGIEPYIAPAILVGFGLFLGLYDLMALEASGLLRVPALIAALIITADGITQIDALSTNKAEAEAEAEAEADAEADAEAASAARTEPIHPGRATHRTQVATTVTPEAPPASSRGPALAYSVLLLAIWLGVASLGSSSATVTLRMTSFLAAILIFYRGWQAIVPKRG